MENDNLTRLFNDPKVQNFLKLLRDSNKSPKELFYEKAKELNVDPETILKQLR